MTIAQRIKSIGDFCDALEQAVCEAATFDSHEWGAQISFSDQSALAFLTASGDIVVI